MDQLFSEKINSIGIWTPEKEGYDQADLMITFMPGNYSIVRVSCGGESFVYDLKPLPDLYAPEKSGPISVKLGDSRYFEVLYTIEGSIKRLYQDMPELTDSSVILVLEKMSAKPEFVDNDPISSAIHQNLRLQLSMSDYSRNEVRQSIRQILKSAKRHKGLSGIRGYLDFILKHVP